MSLYDTAIKAIDMSGNQIDFSSYKGKILLIVNTASKCGFTPQFDGLQDLYDNLKDRGFLVLGFPCNQFKDQDPAENKEILNFCQINYGVDFPMFQKIEVNGPGRHPLYKHLIEENIEGKRGDIKWNFEKFLVDQNGNVIKRFSSIKKPKSIMKDIRKLLD